MDRLVLLPPHMLDFLKKEYFNGEVLILGDRHYVSDNFIPIIDVTNIKKIKALHNSNFTDAIIVSRNKSTTISLYQVYTSINNFFILSRLGAPIAKINFGTVGVVHPEVLKVILELGEESLVDIDNSLENDSSYDILEHELLKVTDGVYLSLKKNGFSFIIVKGILHTIDQYIGKRTSSLFNTEYRIFTLYNSLPDGMGTDLYERVSNTYNKPVTVFSLVELNKEKEQYGILTILFDEDGKEDILFLNESAAEFFKLLHLYGELNTGRLIEISHRGTDTTHQVDENQIHPFITEMDMITES